MFVVQYSGKPCMNENQRGHGEKLKAFGYKFNSFWMMGWKVLFCVFPGLSCCVISSLHLTIL